MARIKDIKDRLRQDLRNKIVFCREYIDELTFVNVGAEYSKLLKYDESAIPSYKSVLSCNNYHPDLGNYLAIENIGILFESELKINIQNLITSYSDNQYLIIKTDAEIKDETLYFLKETDGIKVSLKNLTYIVI